MGFIYFTFVLGFVVIKVLKLYALDELETVLFSIGFSLSSLMIIGLLINHFGKLFGVLRPLSLVPILVVVNIFTLTCYVLVFLRRDKRNNKSDLKRVETFLPALIVLLLIFPLLGVAGALQASVNGVNLLQLTLIVLISLIFSVAVILKTIQTKKIYPIIVFMFALALLCHATFISAFPISYGGDLARELFIYKNTLNKECWQTDNPYSDTRYGRVQSMLSVTILPTIYSNLLNFEPEMVFKILYPIIFAFVPLGLYVVWREKVGGKSAFISAFLFMSYATFYTEIFGLNRQIIAELFFVLLLFIIFNGKIKSNSKMLCFTIFSFALITSHYGIAEIFIFFIFFTLVLLLAKKFASIKISLSMCVLFFAIMFTWYIYIARGATFESFVEYGDYVYRSLSDIFNLEAREPEVLRGLGLEAPPTVWSALSRFFQYVVQFLIIVGFLALIINKKRTAVKLDKESFMLIVVAMVLLGLLIVVPGLSRTMNMTRFFHILLFVVSPLSVIGAEYLAGLLKKNKEFLASIFLIVILVPYFLFQTGFVYEIVGNDTWCLPLSAYRMPAYRSRGQLGLTDERDIICAEWLRVNVNTHGTTVYGDNPSVSYALFAYCMIKKEDMIVLNNVTNIADNSVIYLSRLNTIDNIIVGQKFIWNTSEFPFPNDLSVIYTNGASEIFRK
jgi:uncharacterized membrane protein